MAAWSLTALIGRALGSTAAMHFSMLSAIKSLTVDPYVILLALDTHRRHLRHLSVRAEDRTCARRAGFRRSGF
eukprot:5414543-Pyramimonas_sp.AAC.1